MCGIAGIILARGPADSRQREAADIRGMTDGLAHRGPDGEGFWTGAAGQVYFGHRRLAVIDLSPAAAQPMHLQNRYTIVYNGEVYNHPALREELSARGFVFHTRSDTEVILAAFAHWGAACVEKFDGMFALAVWDDALQVLTLARDRFGQKPLYYCRDANGRLLFASEMKAFWATGFPKKPETNAMLYFLATGKAISPLSPENSFYENIYQVPAAHTLQYHLPTDELQLTRYWDLDRTAQYTGTAAEAMAAIEAALESSVQQSLLADVPCGSTLSGGIDSAAIALNIRRRLGVYPAFSAVFPGFEKDESAAIAVLCAQLGIGSHTISPDAAALDRDFDRFLALHEEPVASAGVFAQHLVCRLAREMGVKVLLDGQGADELMGGYDNSIAWYLQWLWRSGRWQLFRHEKQAFRNNGWTSPFGAANRAAALFPAAAQAALERREKKLVAALPFVNGDLKAAFPAALIEKPLVITLNDLLYDELTRSRLPELLRYADRNSMAFGLELRLPFLNREFAELAFSLPAGYKLRDGFRKWTLRAAMDKKLPAATVWQQGKTGFEPPQLAWMQQPALRDRVHEARKKLVAEGFLDRPVLEHPLKPAPAYQRDNYDWRQLVLASL